MEYDNNNVFARIIRKEIKEQIVYEDDYMLCFHDKEPLGDVHLLIIPKGKYLDYADFVEKASDKEKKHFFDTIPVIAKHNNLTDYRLLTHRGANGGQTVFHFHVHLIYERNYSLR